MRKNVTCIVDDELVEAVVVVPPKHVRRASEVIGENVVGTAEAVALNPFGSLSLDADASDSEHAVSGKDSGDGRCAAYVRNAADRRVAAVVNDEHVKGCAVIAS